MITSVIVETHGFAATKRCGLVVKRPITPPCHGGDRRFESGRARQDIYVMPFLWYYFFMISPEDASNISSVAQLSWEDQRGDTFIADIPQLGINERTMRYVGQGRVSDWMRDSGIETLASEGFSKCAALVIRDRDSEGFAFAHAQPFDHKLYYQLEAREQPPEEALFVFGTHSSHQIDFERLLAGRGARLAAVHVETGDAHFGVAFNPLIGLVSVVRKTPDHAIFQYQPFRSH